MQATATAAPAGSNEQRNTNYLLKESLSFKGSEAGSGRRNAGRQREEGTVLRVVRAVTGSAVKPLLVSQSSLPAVEHAAPTKPSQPGSKQVVPSKTSVEVEAVSEADLAAEEHTAMLKRYRAEWAVTRKDSLWTRLYKNVEWRLFWIGHASGICVLDYEERVVFTLLHLAVLGLLMYEGCRRLMGGLAGLW